MREQGTTGRTARAWLVAAALLPALGCDALRTVPPPRQVPGGDAARGRATIEKYGCTGCHSVPGINRESWVAPPLTNFGDRSFVAGVVSNNSENLIRWIENPKQIAPETAMPNLGVTEADARDIAAYLYTLRSRTPQMPR
ncbi:MAG: c-type cytochrome [Myxococcales bacterium]